MIKTSPEQDYSYWSMSIPDLLSQFNKNQEPQQYQQTGLTTAETNLRLSKYGKNLLKSKRETNSISLLISQFKSPIIIIFIFTSVLSYFLGQIEDALIILSIVVASGILGFWQEKGATDAVTKLLAIVQLKSIVLRDETDCSIPFEDIVPGDIIMLKSGIISQQIV